MPTTYMNLPTPTVGTTVGPDWATNNNNCFTLIDAHDHTTGRGVPITPSGMSINSALTFANNPLTNAQSLGFYAQSAQPSGTKLLYVSGADVFYVDGNSNNIQLTSGGSVNAGAGSITGMGATNAGVTYNNTSKAFVFQSNTGTTTPAIIDACSYVIRNLSASSFGITIAAPTLSANSNQTFPPVAPGSGTKIITMDSTGLWGAAYDVDNSTLQVSSNTLSVKNSGISAGKIASDAVTTAKILAANVTWAKRAIRTTGTSVAIGNVAIGASMTDAWSTSTATWQDVAELGAVTIVTGGGPVFLGVSSDGSTGVAANFTVSANATNTPGQVRFMESATVLALYGFAGGASVETLATPVSSVWMIFTPAAGSHTYKLQGRVAAGDGTALSIQPTIHLVCYEL